MARKAKNNSDEAGLFAFKSASAARPHLVIRAASLIDEGQSQAEPAPALSISDKVSNNTQLCLLPVC
jgi:hypothetical protein